MIYENKINEAEECEVTQCLDCLEGCLLGRNIYCSVDGRFHSPDGGLDCKYFINRNKETQTK
jgi:hypothetical protein